MRLCIRSYRRGSRGAARDRRGISLQFCRQNKAAFNTTPADTLKPPSDQLALIASASKPCTCPRTSRSTAAIADIPYSLSKNELAAILLLSAATQALFHKLLRVLLPKNSFRPKKKQNRYLKINRCFRGRKCSKNILEVTKCFQTFFVAHQRKTDLKNTVPAPFFRRRFTLTRRQSAEITICGLGFYELYINGEKNNQREGLPPTFPIPTMWFTMTNMT